MYLEGRSEKEIDDSCADESGKDKGMDDIVEAASPDSDGGSSNSQEGSINMSVPSPAFSIPSLDSPSLSPTQEPNQQWQKHDEGDRQSYRPGPVGSDPRDSSNPLSISFLTGSQWDTGYGGWNKRDSK